MNTDTKIMYSEAEEVLKGAMLNYPGCDVDITIFLLYRKMGWNKLQNLLSSTDHTSDSKKISEIIDQVETYLHETLNNYLN